MKKLWVNESVRKKTNSYGPNLIVNFLSSGCEFHCSLTALELLCERLLEKSCSDSMVHPNFAVRLAP